MRQAVAMALICLGTPAENSWIKSLTFESNVFSEAPEVLRWKSMYSVVCALALDSKGKAHISYLNGGNSTIKYTTNATGAWENTTLCVGSFNSLALDADDVVHISYFDPNNYDLLYTTGVNNTGVKNKVGWR